MDVYYSKQAVVGIATPKKRSVTALKDTAGSQDGTAQFCNRIGCCGRLNHTKGTKNKCLEKPKPFKSSFRSSSSKEVTASSSKNCSSVRKSHLESDKKPSSKVKTIPAESSSVSDESEIQELNASRLHKERKLKSRNSMASKVSKTTEVPSRSTRIKRVSAPQITDFGIVEKGENGKNGLKSLKCNSISDGYRQKDPNSESNNCGKSTVMKRFTQGESSSSGKGKRVSGISANEGYSRNWTACRTNGGSSVRTRRSMNMDPSKGSVNQLNGDNISLVQSSNVIPDAQTQIVWPSGGTSVTESSVNGGHSANDGSSTMISVSSTDHHPVVCFVNGTRHYNSDGIADVLLTLDRFEQDEELTYEQLLSLETNLFLGGLNFYDQHRDMRLDIDNMSYEELLVLEEKMGTVSTALSEEELSKCIRTSIYESLELEDGRMRCSWGADDSKCSICQEEFVRGDEIGRVGCGHGYHTPCINQWLRLKNWCPICKASPQSSSPA